MSITEIWFLGSQLPRHGTHDFSVVSGDKERIFKKIMNAQENCPLRTQNGISLGADTRGGNSNCRRGLLLVLLSVKMRHLYANLVLISIIVAFCLFR